MLYTSLPIFEVKDNDGERLVLLSYDTPAFPTKPSGNDDFVTMFITASLLTYAPSGDVISSISFRFDAARARATYWLASDRSRDFFPFTSMEKFVASNTSICCVSLRTFMNGILPRTSIEFILAASGSSSTL